MLRIISKVTWRPVAVLEHPEKVTEESIVAFQEVRDGQANMGVDPGCSDDEADDDDGTLGKSKISGVPLIRRRYAVCDKPLMVCSQYSVAKSASVHHQCAVPKCWLYCVVVTLSTAHAWTSLAAAMMTLITTMAT